MSAQQESGPPSLLRWMREGLEIPGLIASPLLPPVPIPAGQGQPVMVLPGYLTTDTSSVRLRRSLGAAGYAAYGWGLGRNVGARAALLAQLGRRITAIARSHGQPVALVGWSLGGVYAREIAKLQPQDVALVITLGSPFSGNPRDNNAWRVYELLNDHPVDNPPLPVNLAAKPPVPTIAVWSRRDGIIAPHAARGLPHESDLRVDVDCLHLTFARAPNGIAAIGTLLAEHYAAAERGSGP
ncbi:MAG: hypothetical protein RL702_2055 [Pseudomonadota bacterium]|jgi:pimeloyl-ACP methyl ester carboxylesterase